MDDIIIAKRSDWDVEDMPDNRRSFTFEHEFTKTQMDTLSRGIIPREMEDRWFVYMEDGILYAHRSWNGCCVFMVEFKKDNHHIVTVNCDVEQLRTAGTEELISLIDRMLCHWC